MLRLAASSACALTVLIALVLGCSSPPADATRRPKGAEPNPLPLPTAGLELADLYTFLFERTYAARLGWHRDEGLGKDVPIRDTGPFVRGASYGTHPSVRCFYSPRMMYWLTGDPEYWPGGTQDGAPIAAKAPRSGEVPDGAMVIKEMWKPPAARYEGWTEEQLVEDLRTGGFGWTAMIKDRKGSKDGWFWIAYAAGEDQDPKDDASDEHEQTYGPPFNYPNTDFGSYCLRCHAAAERDYTFSSTRNIEGLPGDPITFFVDDSWRGDDADFPESQLPRMLHHKITQAAEETPAEWIRVVNREFVKVYGRTAGGREIPLHAPKKFPSENHDRVVAGPDGAEEFLSSDQCMMCHSGAGGAIGPVMFLEGEKADYNVSPYGEWRWSPMGLAGRDPVFHAQLEYEVALLEAEFPDDAKTLVDATQSTCLTCHGVMGKRQHDIDVHGGDMYANDFDRFWVYATKDTDPEHAKYGGLARDGISCAVCHHMKANDAPLADFLANSTTGQYEIGERGTINGPFEHVATFPMKNALGLEPRHDAYIQDSRLCGSCHVINLPIVGSTRKPGALAKSEKNPAFQKLAHGIEQATYLEWLNSDFQKEGPDPEAWGKSAQSCQECHMPGGFHRGDVQVDQIGTKIALFEDQSYPEADHRAPLEDITVRFRGTGYRRHRLQGLNVFLAAMFDQFSDVLGVRKADYMSGSKTDLQNAIASFDEQAKLRTADIAVTEVDVDGNVLTAVVEVTNRTGHRLPSGVSFRRLWIELLVTDEAANRTIWSSGRTNGVGVLVHATEDGTDAILGTEFHEPTEINGETLEYQKHWQTITSERQVQIYEELTKNGKGEWTSSFIHRDEEVKENRLLPAGWREDGGTALATIRDKAVREAYAEATRPAGEAAKDPEYESGSGKDRVTYRVALPAGTSADDVSVQATLYSQSFKPAFLREKFEDVPEGQAGWSRQRLYWLMAHLKTEGTPIAGWKLEVARYPKRPR